VSQIRILVVDDHEAWREFICSVLKSWPEFQVVGEASDGLEAVCKAQELKPDLIVLHTGLPKLNGIEAENQLCELVPSAKVLFLTQLTNTDIVRAAWSNGAQGYVLKFDAGRELLPGIKAILRGEKFVSSGMRRADSKTQSRDSTRLSL
jgi:DNA-binding NarL/FixJ family response regulator